eukprot:CAMPEP_0116109780 /NCGR_PEP_ID=MMETSP0327-20121206/17519_1 /TAXON_ID=44447 /ORGANISM="Pseudo-nitzschia delicatissima, Strain B596" /LENGTH=393 /DNA_ID=CAMNT_0003602817 /DNA_START=6 /DNA_END=1187 /DNA_ORIENTATION=+
MTGGAMEDDSNEKNEAKLASPPSGISTSKDATHLVMRAGGVNESEQDTEPKGAVQKASINENKDGNDDPTENDNIGHKEDFGKTFRSSAKDAMQKAMSLAKASESSTETQSEDKQPSVEILRDLINQHPGEFWQGDDKSTTEKVDLVFEQNESVSPRKAFTQSSFRAKRRKLQLSNYAIKRNKKKEGPSLEDIETLRAVRALLEESLHQLPSKKSSDLANNLLEHFKRADDSDDDPMDGHEFLARKITLSFARDLSKILKAIKASDDSTQDGSSTKDLSPKQPAVEASLLCDEEDIAELRDDRDANNMEEDNDGDIVEISQGKNYVQQHLMCHEETELFGKPSTKDQTSASDQLVSQKMALLRETNRLIRKKALVLAKRRLGIQEEDDLSVVI